MNGDENPFMSFADIVSDELANRELQRPNYPSPRLRQRSHPEKSSVRYTSNNVSPHRVLGDSFLSTIDGGYSDTEGSLDENEGGAQHERSYDSLDRRFSREIQIPLSDKRRAHQLGNTQSTFPVYSLSHRNRIETQDAAPRSYLNKLYPKDNARTDYFPIQPNSTCHESLEETKIKQLVKENMLLTREVDRLTEELVTIQQQQEDHKTALMAAMTEKHEQRIQHVKEDLEFRFKEEKERNSRAEKQADKALGIATEKIEQLEGQLQEALAHCHTAEAAKKEEQDRVAEAKEKIEALQQQITSALNTVAQFSEKHRALGQEYEQLEQTLSERNRTITTHQNKIESFQQEIALLKSEIEQKNTRYDTICCETQSFCEALNSAKTTLEDFEYKCSSLESSLESKEAQLVHEKQRTAVLLQEMKTLRKQIETLSLENSELSVQTAKYCEVARNSWEEAQSVKKEAEILRQRLQQHDQTVRQLQNLVIHSPCNDTRPNTRRLSLSLENILKDSAVNEKLRPNHDGSSSLQNPKKKYIGYQNTSFPFEKENDLKHSINKNTDAGLKPADQLQCQSTLNIPTPTLESNPPPLPPHAANWLKNKSWQKNKPSHFKNAVQNFRTLTGEVEACKTDGKTRELQHYRKSKDFLHMQIVDCPTYSTRRYASNSPENRKSRQRLDPLFNQACESACSVSSNESAHETLKESYKPRSRSFNRFLEAKDTALFFLSKTKNKHQPEVSESRLEDLAKNLPRLLTSFETNHNSNHVSDTVSISSHDESSDISSLSQSENQKQSQSEVPCDTQQHEDEESFSQNKKDDDALFTTESAFKEKIRSLLPLKRACSRDSKGTLLFPQMPVKNRSIARLIKIHSSAGHCRYELQTVQS